MVGFAATGASPVGFAPNGDSVGFADAKLLKPPSFEKELKPPPLATAPLAPKGFAGALDCPNVDAPNPDFPNCAPGVLGVPNAGAAAGWDGVPNAGAGADGFPKAEEELPPS